LRDAELIASSVSAPSAPCFAHVDKGVV
jgi:hypothetical protein